MRPLSYIVLYVVIGLFVWLIGAMAQVPNMGPAVPNQAPASIQPFVATGGVTSATNAARWGHNLNVVDDGGVDNSGATDVSATFQAVINAAAAANSAVYVPCGTYLINSAQLTLPSNTKLHGAGWCATIKQGASLAANPLLNAIYAGTARTLLTNSNYAGNSNIIIEDLSFDFTLAPNTSASHALFFYKTTGLRINHVNVNGGGAGTGSNDGVAIVAGTDFVVSKSRVTNLINACYDTWEGSIDGLFEGNYCDTGSIAAASGIVVSGFKTDLTVATAQRIRVINNTIKNAGATAIWIQGGYNAGGPTYGSVLDAIVANNTINNVTTFHGIKVSDASRIEVSGNIISSVQVNAIDVVSENTNSFADVWIHGNIINACNVAASTNDCVVIGATVSNAAFINNRIVGVAQRYDVNIISGASGTVVSNNTMDSGGTGRINDNGTLTQILDLPGGTATIKNAVGPTFNFTNTANSRTTTFGVTDNFNGVWNCTGSASCIIQQAGVAYFTAASSKLTAAFPIILPNYIVSTLPACSGYTYGLAVVTDATAPLYNSTPVGSGTIVVPVFCNGVGWKTH